MTIDGALSLEKTQKFYCEQLGCRYTGTAGAPPDIQKWLVIMPARMSQSALV